jgi:hypothetical protein
MDGMNGNGWHSLIDGINWMALMDGIDGNGQHSLIDGIIGRH